jgi:hypothetical protein
MGGEVAKRPRGRPTDYTPVLGGEILSLMSEGLSLAAAAAELGFHRQRVYEWTERYPDFADTVKLAQAKRQAFLERRLLSADDGPVVTSTIFALKNAGPDDWRDKREVEHSGAVAVDHTIAAKREIDEIFGPTPHLVIEAKRG